ncbi:MAG: hypothetical protein A2934_03000 [Candidatus Sungbacteria bacterium RIFCSPLOWO2_01_FULL_47_10]|uniref:Cytochrome c domain-containing protein n=1 Tax=Candidatus Sungbacteria bacterium RIFCSPLOWO2_01_FULL_47_10 TaxID=1802276 RepID=A0A1G2L8D6_9BACT|nr:MAG: hypothetical protein A2934_03000 [Candidatus Sungbacteria bacterium RIFCSPLOWO2_01_FULL_47_10]
MGKSVILFWVGIIFIALGCGQPPSSGTETRSPKPPVNQPVMPPPPPAPSARTDGKAIFEKNCATCHGTRGLGDGPMAAGLPNKPTNLALDITQKKEDKKLAEIIKEGTDKGMPPWKYILKEEEIQEVVKHLRELGKKK